MPTYVMYCFKLSKYLTAKLTSVVAQFGWNSNGQQKCMHWLAQKDLCRVKTEGWHRQIYVVVRQTLNPWIPAIHLRLTTCKRHNYYQTFMVNHLIDHLTKTWNMELLDAIITPKDVFIIRSIPLCSTYKPDSLGWHFTKS